MKYYDTLIEGNSHFGYFHIPCREDEHDPIEVTQTSSSTNKEIETKTWWQCRKCGLFYGIKKPTNVLNP